MHRPGRIIAAGAHRTKGAAVTVTIGSDRVPLDDLTPFPGNARRGNVPLILESLRANGQYKPLVVRRQGVTLTVLAGNHTLLALRRHEDGGRDDCPGFCRMCATVDPGAPTALVHIIECDDAAATRINLVDNKAADEGGYDDEALAAILLSLDGELAGTGYAPTEAELFAEDAAEGSPADRLPEPGDAEVSHAEPTWGVVVRCGDEGQQTALLKRLLAEGLDVRALSVM